MSILWFKSGQAIPESRIHSIAPYFTISQERDLVVSAGLNATGEEAAVLLGTQHRVSVEWVAVLNDEEEENEANETVNKEVIVWKHKVDIEYGSDNLDQYIADNARKLKLEDADLTRLAANINKIFSYHKAIKEYEEPTGAAPTAGLAFDVDGPRKSPETIQMELVSREERFRAYLVDLSIIGSRSLKEVAGLVSLQALCAKEKISLADDDLKRLAERPIL